MKKEELEKIIESIETKNSKEKAFFGIHYLDENNGELFIKANKSGLELFAGELLKASKNAEEVIENSEKSYISTPNEKWITGDISIMFIEPKKESRIDTVEDIPIQNWKYRVLTWFLLWILCSVGIIFIIGVQEVFKNLFS